jgi:hypothetical protein
MAKPSLTTRTAKGSPLTIAEMDANLTNLRDTTITFKAPGTRTQINSIGGMYESSTAQVKFGERSVRFNGSSHGINMNWMPGSSGMNPFELGMSEFSIEMWIWIDDMVTTTRYILDMRNMGNNALSLYLDSANNIVAQRGSTNIATTANPLAAGGWRHIAIERASYMGTGATLQSGLYIITDGAINGTGWQNTMDMFDSTSQVYIGQDYNSSNRFQGYIDEFRMSSVVRYLKNNMSMANTFPVAVPTAAFTNDSSTKVLLHFDESMVLVDDYFDAATLDMGDTIFINEGMNMNVTLSNSPTKQLSIGFDSSTFSAPANVAVATSQGMTNGKVDWSEQSDQNNLLQINMGSGEFQIQNNSNSGGNYIIEVYGVAKAYTSNTYTTPLTGSFELYNNSQSYGETTVTIYDGFVPSFARSVNVMSNSSTTYYFRPQSGNGNEAIQGTLILKVTKVS